MGPLNYEQQYGYDANGNLLSDGARTYAYDIENRLVGSGNLTLAYDPLGRLFQTSGLGLATTRYLYDGDALVAEYDGAGLMTRRYVHWAGADVPMVSYPDADLTQPSYLHADHQGSIIAVANANGQTITPNSYDEYGVPAATNVGRFGYTGQIWIPELGMYHYKARVYSPPLGRFMQTDPVGYDDQFNLYAYVGNDPINRRDPSGEQTVDDMQLQAQMEDMRQQGRSEAEIRQAVHDQAILQANALLAYAGLVDGYALASWGARAFLGWRAMVVAERAITSGRLVLYSGAVPATLARGEVAINMKAGWTLARNDRLIAAAIRQGRPIRDSHLTASGRLAPVNNPNSVLLRERRQLQQAGWRFNRSSGEWKPPTQGCTGTRLC